MSRESLVFVVGAILFLFPFLGVPQDFKDVVTVASGVVLMVLGVILRRSSFLRSIENSRGERQGDMFTESRKIPDESQNAL